MKPRNLILFVVALIGLLTGLVYFKGSREESTVTTTSTLTQEEKDRIRSFWDSYRQARELKLEGRWKEAISHYELALELDPRHEDTLYNLANCHFELGQFEDALKYLKRLVKVSPLSQRGNHQIGLVHACPQAGPLFDLEAARAALNRAFEINKEETGSLLRLGEVALAQGDGTKAFELFTLANQSNFRAVEGYYLRAYLRWEDGRLDEARTLLAEALRQSKKPTVVAGVPGEGDTRAGSSLPPTTVVEKRLLRAFWSDLAERHPQGKIDDVDLEAEFTPLKTYLSGLVADN